VGVVILAFFTWPPVIDFARLLLLRIMC